MENIWFLRFDSKGLNIEPHTAMTQHPKNAPTRLLILSSAGEIAGSEFSLLEYLKHLDNNRYEFQVVCMQPGPFPISLQRADIPVTVIPLQLSRQAFFRFSSIKQNSAALWKIARLLRATAADLVLVNDTMLLKVLLLPLLFCKKPTVYYLRNYEWKRLWMIRLLFRKKKQHGLAVSRSVLNHYRTVVGIPAQAMSVAYVSVDASFRQQKKSTPSLKKELHLPRRAKIIGLIARFDTWKGHLTMLRAIERLAETIPSAHLVIAGETMNEKTFPFLIEYKAKVLQYAQKPTLAPRVHILGWRNDISNIFQSLDILVCPSELEPFARVVLEAMAHGKPVIGADSGGTPEIIRHEQNGLLFRTGNDDDLALCLARLLKNPRYARKLAAEGQRTVTRNYTMQTSIDTIEQVYNRILT